MFGLSAGRPAARRLARHRHLAAIPASMHASDEPMAEAPTVLAASGAFHRSAIMWTHRRSISAVCGYSSLSIMFLLTDSAIRPITSGSTQVWQKVARFWRALPSSISSSDTSWNASLDRVSSSGNLYLGTGLVRSRSANTQSSSSSRTVSRSCSGISASPLIGLIGAGRVGPRSGHRGSGPDSAALRGSDRGRPRRTRSSPGGGGAAAVWEESRYDGPSGFLARVPWTDHPGGVLRPHRAIPPACGVQDDRWVSLQDAFEVPPGARVQDTGGRGSLLSRVQWQHA